MCPVYILVFINEGTPLGMFDEDFVTQYVCATTGTTTTTTIAVVIAESSALNIFAYTYTQAELCVCAQFTA